MLLSVHLKRNGAPYFRADVRIFGGKCHLFAQRALYRGYGQPIHKPQSGSRLCWILGPPVTQLREYFTPEEARALDSAGALGETIGTFVNSSGNIVGRQFDSRRIAVDSEDLLRVPHVIAAAGSVVKAPAIMATVRSGLITQLITDDQAAMEMLRMPPIRNHVLERH